MLKNYLTTIFRQLNKHKTFSFINIFGLALGMAACLFIAQYVKYHRSFDNFHQKSNKVFRIEPEAILNGKKTGTAVTSPAMISQTLKEQSPNVSEVVRFYPYNYANNTIIYQDGANKTSLEQEGVYGGEKSMFRVFDFRFKSGGYSTFDQPLKAILTESTAEKYFTSSDEAVGKVFTLSNNTSAYEYEVVGVLEDFPDNSHIQFEVLLSYPSIDNYTQARTSWTYNAMITYLLLNDGTLKDRVTDEMDQLYREHQKEAAAQAGYEFTYQLQELGDIHLSTLNINDFTRGVDRRIIVALSLIALVILIIAWINYMNLSLVRTMERLKEIGVRKCMGSSIQQVTQLFLLEALVMNMLAFGVAICLNQLGASYLSDLTGLPSGAVTAIAPFLYLSLLILAGTLIIGFYPYAVLKAVNISNILVGKKGKLSGNRMKKGLVFLQFVVTTLLIACTLTIYYQNNYMLKADLKIDVDNVLVIQSPPSQVNGGGDRETANRFNTFKTELLANPSITQITNAGEIPGEDIGWGASLYLKIGSEEHSIATSLISMDLEFTNFFDIDLVAGRKLRRGDDPWSKGDVLINERLSEMLGFDTPEDAIGAEIDGFYSRNSLKVRGVLENHHHTSLHNDFVPIAYILSSWTEYYFLKYELNQDANEPLYSQVEDLIAQVKSEWNGIFTDYQMNYFFLDQSFDLQYQEDIRFSKMIGGFSVLAIVIACLGLFGLTSFTIQQRRKEIGIRKVLGAGFQSLMHLLSKEYLSLVTIASMVGLPVAWWLMNKWLQEYPFTIKLGWWFYVAPIGIILALAFLSIVAKIINTVKSNPVES
ncbi:MAG: ABC transporter permease, partial [Bacteroidota bacterium]